MLPFALKPLKEYCQDAEMIKSRSPRATVGIVAGNLPCAYSRLGIEPGAASAEQEVTSTFHGRTLAKVGLHVNSQGAAEYRFEQMERLLLLGQ